MQAMAMAPPKPYVFMHYSNPTEDSKRLENRQKVAKYAMLGRQKKPTENGSQSRQQQQSQQQPPQQQQQQQSPPRRSQSRSSNGKQSENEAEWARIQRSVSTSYPDPSPLPSLSGSISSASTLSNYSGSPPLPAVPSPQTWSSSAHTQPNHTSARQFINRQDSGFDSNRTNKKTFPALSPTDFSAFNNVDHDVYEPLDVNLRHQGALIRRDDSRLTNKKREGKKRHDVAKTSRSNGSQNMIDRPASDNSAMISVSQPGSEDSKLRMLNPRSLLSASSSDPFASLPIKANAHTHELMYQYMNARLVSSVYARGSPETFDRIKKMRHTVWGPLTMKSKAAMSALVAYVESTPGLPIKSRSKDYLFSHVQTALGAVRDALSRPDVATDDGICLAVVLLMLTAQREGNTETYSSHAAGLATLLSYRTQAIHRHGEQHDTVSRLRQFYNRDSSEECNYCQKNGSPSRSRSVTPLPLQEAFVIDSKTFSEACYPRGEGFRHLMRQGLLTEQMKSFIEPAMIWSELAERARRDKLSAAIGATHAWIDEGEFSLANMSHPLDTAVFTAVRLCFYLSSWLDWQHSCFAVRQLASAVHMALQHTDLEHHLINCPDAIMWLCLMAGPLCEGATRAWFSTLLARAIAVLNGAPMGFQGKIDFFTQYFIWSATITNVAHDFWDETYMQSPPIEADTKFDSTDFGLTNGFYPSGEFDQPTDFSNFNQPGHITEIWDEPF